MQKLCAGWRDVFHRLRLLQEERGRLPARARENPAEDALAQRLSRFVQQSHKIEVPEDVLEAITA